MSNLFQYTAISGLISPVTLSKRGSGVPSSRFGPNTANYNVQMSKDATTRPAHSDLQMRPIVLRCRVRQHVRRGFRHAQSHR